MYIYIALLVIYMYRTIPNRPNVDSVQLVGKKFWMVDWFKKLTSSKSRIPMYVQKLEHLFKIFQIIDQVKFVIYFHHQT